MNVIVVGCGRVGSQLGTLLSVEGHNVVLIDKDPESFNRLGGGFNGVTIKGYGFDEEILEEAGIRNCDAFAAVTNLDNTNLMAAEVARKIFGVPHVVARLYNPVRERTYMQLGMDYVCGTTLVAETLLDKIMAGHGHHITNLGDVEVINFKASSKLDGLTVSAVEIKHQFRIAAVARGDVMSIPGPDMALRAGDVVLASIKEEAFHKVSDYMED
ncbi:MAG: TrkA family potassium uptake protein [Actinobacteria bacterium]|nr:TrkA family potassium uptake protein [Actinomycetota bacterium]MCL5887936.1 TrkA family potassium uptake protein [Actinomycetota bacterium]